MANKAVIRGAGYALVHAPDMVLNNGTTLAGVRRQDKNSEILKQAKAGLRPFDEVVSYPPNQCYIGNMTPEQLKEMPAPWYENPQPEADRFGLYGEIMPQDEFIGLMKIADSFDLVVLEESFLLAVKEKLQKHPIMKDDDLVALDKGATEEVVKDLLEKHEAAPLTHEGKLVGCVKKGHEYDENLRAHVLLENIATKASGFLALRNLLYKNEIKADEIEYIIESSEEACGDMNQRGGGNFAKAVGEMVGCVNATGSDLRGFCAAPAHSLVSAAALIQAGVYKNVVVVAGGATAKLGMNARDHLQKDLPVLEDVLGAFAVLLSADDGINPIVRLDAIGRNNIGSGTSPQAVTTGLVAEPLEKVGLTIKDVDKYSAEMQNPEITKPAGAGDVPQANYKMIAALGVMRGDIEKKDLLNFVEKHGMVGWSPTQGHIPSGVPYIGFARQALLDGKLNRVMVIGKGSLFLARMTNLFDGISFLIEKNTGLTKEEPVVTEGEIRKILADGLRKLGDSLGSEDD